MKRQSDTLARLQRIAISVAILAVILVGAWLYGTIRDSSLDVGADDTIDITPTQIERIRSIGEWEFLSISNEELVDTVRKGLLSDDQLVRIYYGTLRLGIDTRDLPDGWLTQHGDTVRAVLPQVKLLDRNFIDEARTKSFFESGSWKAKDREALYQKARRQMLNRCMTRENLQTAQRNAEAHFAKMLRSMGFAEVTVESE